MEIKTVAASDHSVLIGKKSSKKKEEFEVTKELLESVTTESSSTEEEKPHLDRMKHITLNGYFKVSEGVYAIMKRNITRGVNTLLLGPTGVN